MCICYCFHKLSYTKNIFIVTHNTLFSLLNEAFTPLYGIWISQKSMHINIFKNKPTKLSFPLTLSGEVTSCAVSAHVEVVSQAASLLEAQLS